MFCAKGVKHGPCSVDLFYGTPTPGNATAMRLYVRNVFSITRQLRYSKDETRLALDLCLFINGLPFATFELKNRLTKQTVEDAVNQYKRDRDPKELLFGFGPVRSAFRGGRPEGENVHGPERQVELVSSLRPGFRRRCGQPAEPQRSCDRLFVEKKSWCERA